MPPATAFANRLTHSIDSLGEVLTRPPEPEEVPAFCRRFFPNLQVAYVVRADRRAIHEVPLERLSREHGGLLLDPSVEADGVHYRLDSASPWRGPFEGSAAAYGHVWAREVCG